MSVSWPRDLELSENVPAVATTGDLQTHIGSSRYTGLVSSVRYIAAGAQAGAATNNRTFTLYNRGGSAGSGTVPIATLQLVSGTDLSDNVAASLTLSTASGAREVNPGDSLEWVSAAVSSGLPDPGGRVIVQLSMRS